MFELPVAAARRYHAPSIVLGHTKNLGDLHDGSIAERRVVNPDRRRRVGMGSASTGAVERCYVPPAVAAIAPTDE